MGLIEYEPSLAAGYLQHVRHPVQIASIEAFVRGLPETCGRRTALDLGCAPGTGISLGHGWTPVAIDFSIESLRIDAARTAAAADLRQVRSVGAGAGLLLMTDFLKHIATVEARRDLLAEAFAGLAPEGRFCLSFMSLDIVDRLKKNRLGSCADGTIPYERQTWRDVMRIMPGRVIVAGRQATNTSRIVGVDRMLSRLPFITLLARMIVLTGHERGYRASVSLSSSAITVSGCRSRVRIWCYY